MNLSDAATRRLSIPTVSMVSLSSIRSWALGISMCMRSVCCCLFIGSVGRVFLLAKTKQKRGFIIRISCGREFYWEHSTFTSSFLPHKHLSQTFSIWKTNRENISFICKCVQKLKHVISRDLSSHLWASWASAPFSSSSVPEAQWRLQQCPPTHRKLSPSFSVLHHHQSGPHSHWGPSLRVQWYLGEVMTSLWYKLRRTTHYHFLLSKNKLSIILCWWQDLEPDYPLGSSVVTNTTCFLLLIMLHSVFIQRNN